MKSRTHYRSLSNTEVRWLKDNYAIMPEKTITNILGITAKALDYYTIEYNLGLSHDDLECRRQSFYP